MKEGYRLRLPKNGTTRYERKWNRASIRMKGSWLVNGREKWWKTSLWWYVLQLPPPRGHMYERRGDIALLSRLHALKGWKPLKPLPWGGGGRWVVKQHLHALFESWVQKRFQSGKQQRGGSKLKWNREGSGRNKDRRRVGRNRARRVN